jgi:hypothetical protein
MTGASATAAGQVGSANAWSGGLSNAYKNYMNQQSMGSLFSPGGPGYVSPTYGAAGSAFDSGGGGTGPDGFGSDTGNYG